MQRPKNPTDTMLTYYAIFYQNGAGEYDCWFFKEFKEAGGKFVSIVRKGIPDLPKGHIEQGETPEVAALREVEEETGIGKLHIINELPSTWHCYLEHDEWTLKRTYWYLMESEETIQPKPQTEEGITEIKLIGNEGIEDFLKNTFRSISEILGKDLRQITTK